MQLEMLGYEADPRARVRAGYQFRLYPAQNLPYHTSRSKYKPNPTQHAKPPPDGHQNLESPAERERKPEQNREARAAADDGSEAGGGDAAVRPLQGGLLPERPRLLRQPPLPAQGALRPLPLSGRRISSSSFLEISFRFEAERLGFYWIIWDHNRICFRGSPGERRNSCLDRHVTRRPPFVFCRSSSPSSPASRRRFSRRPTPWRSSKSQVRLLCYPKNCCPIL